MTHELLPLRDLVEPVVLSTAEDGTPRLVGSRCRHCDARAFPRRTVCFGCLGSDLEDMPLSTSGRLYSYSTVRVSASREVPYTLGYVDLPEGPRVLAHLAGELDGYTVDQRVRLEVAADGSWAFGPDTEVSA
ncbi:MAG: OB-fold domain-containing protein [Streptosporangiales bacterium]|nr:OB-fold domain-containing protein [Streptosporangiales bacterium]